jgi:molybdopterin/thiamine biosynthesis adenylyltransferase/molybdopterin converting factor small subunit
VKVVVRYLAQVKAATGQSTEEVDLAEGAIVADLLARLVEQHGPALERLAASALVFVGDEQAGPETTLREGESVTLLSPIAGGSQAPLDAAERAVYEWQLAVPGFGEEGQRRLKQATVLVSRCGGVGGAVAAYLAAAGVGKLVLAHAGNVRPDDLNRQLLMTWASLGTPRMEIAPRRLRELNPFVAVEAVAENISEENASRLVGSADLVVSCAPLFAERLLLNREAVRQGKPLVDCAMYELEMQLTTVLPGRAPCLACLYPTAPPAWQRKFPVFGAVAGTVGSLGAMEAIKVLAGLGEPLLGRLLLGDLRDMTFRRVTVKRAPDCAVCGHL